MRLTSYTDFALRLLIHLAAHDEKLCSISEVAGAYRISQNHLMKVANDLSRAGFVDAVRGRSGGLRLARPAEEINVGQVVRHTEKEFELADCSSCMIAPACLLSNVLDEAVTAFLKALDGYSLGDLVTKRRALRRILNDQPTT